MATLLLRLIGPMQSWGYKSVFELRNTQPEPTKSGVIGLICAALGRDRNEPMDDLTRLKMGVRVDNPGQLAYDYQTALSVAKADGSKTDTQTSQRAYLSDAAFWVGLEGDKNLLTKVYNALLNPVWPVFLGRKSYLSSEPVAVSNREEVLVELELDLALSAAKPLVPFKTDEKRKFVIECMIDEDPTHERDDVPLSFAFEKRAFTSRLVREEWKELHCGGDT